MQEETNDFEVKVNYSPTGYIRDSDDDDVLKEGGEPGTPLVKDDKLKKAYSSRKAKTYDDAESGEDSDHGEADKPPPDF
jgi:hypothetical protein